MSWGFYVERPKLYPRTTQPVRKSNAKNHYGYLPKTMCKGWWRRFNKDLKRDCGFQERHCGQHGWKPRLQTTCCRHSSNALPSHYYNQSQHMTAIMFVPLSQRQCLTSRHNAASIPCEHSHHYKSITTVCVHAAGPPQPTNHDDPPPINTNSDSLRSTSSHFGAAASMPFMCDANELEQRSNVTPGVLAYTFALALHSMSMCISHSFLIVIKMHATYPCNLWNMHLKQRKHGYATWCFI
jgi:hypothetical protein